MVNDCFTNKKRLDGIIYNLPVFHEKRLFERFKIMQEHKRKESAVNKKDILKKAAEKAE